MKKSDQRATTKSVAKANPWVTLPSPNSSATVRLFCFPYGGGGSVIFREWPDGLPAFIEVCAVQLPGRGSRLMEEPFTEMGALVPVLAENLQPYLTIPFAFFGHSLGAFISFELARYLRTKAMPEPQALFVSGAPAPQLRRSEPPLHDLPESELIKELRKFNGTPNEVLEHAELMQLMLPTLRADFTLLETYSYKTSKPLDCPIIAFGGTRDHSVTAALVEAWRAQTNTSFSRRMVPGDHFFVNTNRKQLLLLISRQLSRRLSARAL